MKKKVPMKRIAVLTSGGDAPGMNAAIRAVVRQAVSSGLQVVGFRRGFMGLMEGDHEFMNSRSVSNIVQRGGTILRTARSSLFETGEGLLRSRVILEKIRIDGLIVIGGDGSFRGAAELQDLWGGKILGVPGTIDNDLFGTDFTIGFDTAVNTALQSIDKIRDTAEAHERFFLVEVMGRHSGFIALEVGIGGGAEEILMPGSDPSVEAICERLCAGKARGKTSSIIVVAEGVPGGAFRIAEELRKLSGNEYRVAILGHLQRGGAPTARDRLLAGKLGCFAVRSLLDGHGGKMAGEVCGRLCLTPLDETWRRKKEVDPYLVEIVRTLST